jgi:hypothetical protein
MHSIVLTDLLTYYHLSWMVSPARFRALIYSTILTYLWDWRLSHAIAKMKDASAYWNADLHGGGSDEGRQRRRRRCCCCLGAGCGSCCRRGRVTYDAAGTSANERVVAKSWRA